MFKKRKRLTEKTNFPSGSVVRTEKGTFFVKGPTLLRITSDNILDSWKFNRIIEADFSALAGFTVAGKLGFRDGTVLKAFGSRRYYLISQQKARHLVSAETLVKLRIKQRSIIIVSDDEVKIHKEGDPIGSI